ncbi:MAG: porin family protein [Candidatus Jidaibacter sp.]|jgi:outer membrane autotransporter protein|nr:porin family protein [Candidatus Jidaibacter sp.]
MKSKILKLAIAVAPILIFTDALAFQRDGKVYMDLNLGYGIQNVERKITLGFVNYNFKENNKGIVGKLGIGYHLLDEIRVGVSVMYTPKLRSSKADGNNYSEELKAKMMGVFGDVYYDFLTGSRFNPFVLAGVGMMNTEYKQKLSLTTLTDNAKKSKTRMAYKLGAGLSYHINTSLDLDFTYQAVLAGSSSKNDINLDYKGPLIVLSPDVKLKPAMFQSILIGLRYTF